MKTAVESLRDLGLTEYEAKVYTALVKIRSGTASDIHLVSGIPRSAVYGALHRLEERGTIEVQSSKPMRYRAVPPEIALGKLKDNFIAESEDALVALEEIYQAPKMEAQEEAIWTISGVKNVSDKIIEMIRDAQTDIIFAASYPSFHEIAKTYPIFENVKGEIITKIEEGVTVRVTGSRSEELEEITKDIPGAQIREFPADKSTASGGILIVDGKEVLIAIMSENADTGMYDLMAIYTSGDGAASIFKHFVETEWDASVSV
ncbi:MAG: HTH-type sugar sensing transcriptional regulator TrmBL1 [ANME-2 cluster archaeon]|nr:HTH-type sugar sensing transcriptional regulator TrmBL1 [ANME-2 cluster archaeon]